MLPSPFRTDRLLSCGCIGLGMLITAGCGTLPRLRSEPDHVYSTTTPQMLQEEANRKTIADEAGRKPIAVEASYPDEETDPSGRDTADRSNPAHHLPHSESSTADGVVRMDSREVHTERGSAADAAFEATNSTANHEILEQDVSEFQLVSYQKEGDSEQDFAGNYFSPAEPRLACDARGLPLHQMETVAPSALADLYPDEYVFDGGDRDAPADVHSARRSGLDSEDTVAAYTDSSGKNRTSPSNRVAVYSPRFGSVRTVVGIVADVKVDRAAGAEDNVAAGNLMTGNAAQENVNKTASDGLQNRRRVDGMNGATPPMQARRTETPSQNHKVDEGHEGRLYSSSGSLHRNDGIVLARQLQNASVWTRDDFPLITATTSSASEVTARFKVQQTIGMKDEREKPGNVHIVKLADRDTAQPGESILFTINFENTGDFDVYDVRIVDNLTSRLQYVTGSASIDEDYPGEVIAEPNGEGSSVLTFVLDTPLKAHTRGSITFEATVR